MPGMRWPALIVAPSLLLLLAGCSSAVRAASPARKVSTTATRPSTYPGETAAAIAGMIPGCANVTASEQTDGTRGAPSSAASCVVGGRKIWINSYRTAADADASDLLQQNKVEMYWLLNNQGWSVIPDDAGPVELQLTTQAGELFRQQLAGKSPAPADVLGELASMKAVQAALGGTIFHVLADGTSAGGS